MDVHHGFSFHMIAVVVHDIYGCITLPISWKRLSLFSLLELWDTQSSVSVSANFNPAIMKIRLIFQYFLSAVPSFGCPSVCISRGVSLFSCASWSSTLVHLTPQRGIKIMFYAIELLVGFYSNVVVFHSDFQLDVPIIISASVSPLTKAFCIIFKTVLLTDVYHTVGFSFPMIAVVVHEHQRVSHFTNFLSQFSLVELWDTQLSVSVSPHFSRTITKILGYFFSTSFRQKYHHLDVPAFEYAPVSHSTIVLQEFNIGTFGA